MPPKKLQYHTERLSTASAQQSMQISGYPRGIAFSLLAHDVEHRVDEFRTLRSSERFRRGGGRTDRTPSKHPLCSRAREAAESEWSTNIAVN